ncbi:MAG: ferritin-like domain-containing protein [Myxococcota bacterium]|nr:ferritin-like domain-containing protein [Myxococcota bacterium]
MPILDLTRAATEAAVQLPAEYALNDAERTAAIGTWRGRMINEHISARIFAGLIPQMMAADIGADHIKTVADFINEELTHAEKCAAVVRAVGGEPIAALPDLPPVPSHPECEPLEAFVRNLLSICCMSETVAVALIGAERLETGPDNIEELLRTILADEVGHARFGWRLLDELSPRIDDAMRIRLSDYLISAFQHLEEHELDHLPPTASPSRTAAAVGVCDGNDARRLFFECVETVIVPGLEKRGFDGRRAWDAAKTLRN